MTWFQKMFARHSTGPPHIGENCTRAEMSRRLATLSNDEQKAYNWLFAGYSESWTTETLGLERRNAKKLFTQIYRKLGIESVREIIQYFAPEGLYFEEHPGADATNNKF